MQLFSPQYDLVDEEKAISIVKGKNADISITFSAETDITIYIDSKHMPLVYIKLYARDYTKEKFHNILNLTKQLSGAFNQIGSFRLDNLPENMFSSDKKYLLDMIPSLIGQHEISFYSIKQGQEKLLEYIHPYELCIEINMKADILDHPNQLKDELHTTLETCIRILKTTKINNTNLLFRLSFYDNLNIVYDICKQYLADQPYKLELLKDYLTIVVERE